MKTLEQLKYERDKAYRELNEKFPSRDEARIYLHLVDIIDRIKDPDIRAAFGLFLMLYKQGLQFPKNVLNVLKKDYAAVSKEYREDIKELHLKWYEASLAYNKANVVEVGKIGKLPISKKGAIAQYLTIGEAAVFLGVSMNTLRNWDNTKKLKGYRNSINNYRLYKKEDLEELLQSFKKD